LNVDENRAVSKDPVSEDITKITNAKCQISGMAKSPIYA
jgi:hypothetical protein